MRKQERRLFEKRRRDPQIAPAEAIGKRFLPPGTPGNRLNIFAFFFASIE